MKKIPKIRYRLGKVIHNNFGVVSYYHHTLNEAMERKRRDGTLFLIPLIKYSYE